MKYKTEPLPIIVVGAGIIGSAIAYNLAKVGMPVKVIEKSSPASGATGASFAWIGKPGGQDRIDASTPLRLQVLDDWKSLAAELPDVVVRWTGSILWHNSYLSGGYTPISDEQEFLDNLSVLQREPCLRTPPPLALHNLKDGAVDPVAVTKALLAGASDFGADILTDTSVPKLSMKDGKVVSVETSCGHIFARTVVIAAGAESTSLLIPLGVSLPIISSPALMIKIAAPHRVIRTIIWSQEIEARQATDGIVLVPVEHQGETSEHDLLRTAVEVRLRIANTFMTELDELELVDAQIGNRPMPADGLPLIGALPTVENVYVAVMHSGVSLAPTVGRLVATELVGGIETDELRTLRPNR